MTCAVCGHSNPPDTRFCTNCGVELPGTCPSCYTTVTADQNFCGTCGFDLRAARVQASGENSPASHTPPHLAQRILADRHALVGERKRVTVMFADLVGSTAATENADPEQAAAFLNTALGAMMDAVHRYEGTVNELLGDGIVALFGAPIAHEDHAVRACLAGLQIESAVSAATGGRTRTRVGLHSGEVFVQAIGNDLALEYQALGPTVHLAARMEQQARPGAVCLTATTLGLAQGFVEGCSLGPTDVKGVSEPIEVFELLGIAAGSSWDARAARGLSRFVARETELTALATARARAADGDGQVVAVVGEAGVGKSRLLHEFLASLGESGITPVRAAASAHDEDTTYFAVKGLVRSMLSLDREIATLAVPAIASALERIDSGLGVHGPALAAVLDLDMEGHGWVDLPPEARRRRIRDAVGSLVLELAAREPLVVAIEDLHWLDGGSQVVLDDLVEIAGGSRILLLATYRPEYAHGWDTKSCYTRLRLDPLSTEEAASLVDALIGSDSSLTSLRSRLVTRTEGSPLFLEEWIRSLVESGQLVGAPGDYRLTEADLDNEIPDSVQAVLAARLDRLAAAEKAVVQAASVIGETIDGSLLEAITEGTDLEKILGELQDREFVYANRAAPAKEYRFKHALTRDVAYASLPLAQRRELHGRIVHLLKRDDVFPRDDRVERLAYHALRGELWEDAVDFAVAAGEKGISRSAYAEAARFLRSAVQALEHLPDTPDTIRRAIDVRMRQRVAETGSHGGFARIAGILREASDLAASIDDEERMANVGVHLGYAANMQGDAAEAEDAGRRTLAIAQRLHDRYLAAEARLVLAQTYSYAGRPREVVEVLADDLAYFSGEVRHQRFGQTMIRSVVANCHVAMAYAFMGLFDRADEHVAVAHRIAEEAARPFDLLYVNFTRGVVLDMAGRSEEAIISHQRVDEIGETYDIWFMMTFAQPWQGHALLNVDRAAEAAALLDRVRFDASAASLEYVESLASVFAAEAHRRLGDNEIAAELAANALAFAVDRGLPVIEIPALRTTARLATSLDERRELLSAAEATADRHGYGPWLESIRRDRGD